MVLVFRQPGAVAPMDTYRQTKHSYGDTRTVLTTNLRKRLKRWMHR